MHKVLTVCVLALLPALWYPAWGQAPSVGKKASSNKEQNTALSQPQSQDARGTKDVPLIVDTKGHKDTPQETAKNKADEDHKASVDRWTVGSAVAVAVFTGVLMVIGGCGVRAANRTLKAIEAQTIVAKTNTDALIGIERPWIVVQPSPMAPDLEAAVPGFTGAKMHVFVYRIWNAGRSTAKEIRISTKYLLLERISDLPAIPEYDTLQDFPGVIVPTDNLDSGNALLGWTELKPVSILWQSQIDKITTQQQLLYAYGIIRYKYGIESDGITKFGFLYHFPIGGDVRPRGFYPGGPAAYNEAK